MNNESEFYVGYLPIPPGLKKLVRRVVAGLAVLVVAAAALLVAGQHPFAESSFDFQKYSVFQGSLMSGPYPSLVVAGQGPPWLLVGPGKHGALALPAGREVRLKGERIIRGEDRMIELLPGSVEDLGPATKTAPFEELGSVQFTGEVVDSKCYFGVMNPGNGKVHRDCAARCISGGIPPVFLVRDAGGRTATLLLANWKREMLDHIAEPVTLRGRLARSAGRLILFAE